MKKFTTKNLAVCGLMAAVMCVCSMFTIPAGPVSITLSVFGVLLSAVMLGRNRAVIATAVFILLGAIGLPVFSGMRGGFGMLTGPTGGYIWAYIPMALIVGLTGDKVTGKFRFPAVIGACFAGAAICDLLGAAQYALVTDTGFGAALAVCFAPFIALDCAKGTVAALLGLKIRKILRL